MQLHRASHCMRSSTLPRNCHVIPSRKSEEMVITQRCTLPCELQLCDCFKFHLAECRPILPRPCLRPTMETAFQAEHQQDYAPPTTFLQRLLGSPCLFTFSNSLSQAEITPPGRLVVGHGLKLRRFSLLSRLVSGRRAKLRALAPCRGQLA